jgi:hypothetical protein
VSNDYLGPTPDTTVNSEYLDLGYQGAPEGRLKRHYHPLKPPCLPTIFLEGPAPGEDREGGGVVPDTFLAFKIENTGLLI